MQETRVTDPLVNGGVCIKMAVRTACLVRSGPLRAMSRGSWCLVMSGGVSPAQALNVHCLLSGANTYSGLPAFTAAPEWCAAPTAPLSGRIQCCGPQR